MMRYSDRARSSLESTGEHQRKPEGKTWRNAIKTLTFRRRRSVQNGADLARDDRLSNVTKDALAENRSYNHGDSAGAGVLETACTLNPSGLSLFRGVTFRVVDPNGRDDSSSFSPLRPSVLKYDEGYGSKLAEGTARGKGANTCKQLSFCLHDFPVRGASLRRTETNHKNSLRNTEEAEDNAVPGRQRLPRMVSSGHGGEGEDSCRRIRDNNVTVPSGFPQGKFSCLLDVDAANELPACADTDTYMTRKPGGCLYRLYRKICSHPVYKFFPDEDIRYFNIMVTGLPVYFSSKKLERSFVLYSCPALSAYIIGFHTLFILCTVLQFIFCFVVQPGFYETWRLQVPFFFSWVISFGSIVITIIWRVTGGRKAERFNRHENRLMTNIELPAGKVIQEAVHWRPCFTEDFAAVSFSLALGIPIMVSGSIIAYLFCTTKDEPLPSGSAPPIFNSTTGLFGFAASQAFLALSVLFLSAAVLASGIRVRKLLFVCAALLLSTFFFHICCSLLFAERTLLFPGLLLTYSMIPVSIISRMRTERLRRFLFLLHERAQYAQRECIEDSTYGIQSSTPVEELIMLINEAGLKVRQARSKNKYKKSLELLESEAMLVRCLMILTAGGDLFAFRLNEGQSEDGKNVRDDLLNLIGSAVRPGYHTSRRNARIVPVVRDVTSIHEEDDDQSQDHPADHAADAMTSFHTDSVLDLWALLDLPSAPANGSTVLDGRANAMCRRFDRHEQSSLLSYLPVFPSARIGVAYSKRLTIDSDLDMIDVEKNCDGYCLYRVGCDLVCFKVHGFDCRKQTIKNFMRDVFRKVVQMCYQQTVYHNSLHGAQVAHNTMWLARKLNLMSDLDAAELVGIIIAALCHDIGHQGKNNAYYITSRASVSLIYNDTAVLENFHACTTFKILARPDCNIYCNLEEEAFRSLRMRIIELILATDMKMHFESISKFRLRRSAPDFSLLSEDDRWYVGMKTIPGMALRMCIKGGDLSHATLNWSGHVSWSYRATAEFYEQGDLELSQGRTVANMFDRRKHGDFPKGQEAFLKYIVVPLYEEIAAVDTSGEVQSQCLKRITENRDRWCQLQNNLAELAALDDEQQRKVKELQDALQIAAKINTACTQAILRAAQRCVGGHCTCDSSFGVSSAGESASSGNGTQGGLPDTRTMKTATAASPPFLGQPDERALIIAGKSKKREGQRASADVVQAVKETLQHVAQQAAESASKAIKEIGNTGVRATRGSGRRVEEAASVGAQQDNIEPRGEVSAAAGTREPQTQPALHIESALRTTH